MTERGPTVVKPGPLMVLFTDFGIGSPYVAEIQARILCESPGAKIVPLFSDAPAFDPQLSAYLLAAYGKNFPTGSIFVCVVDPGVGSKRRALAVEVDGRWFVGPDNGLFEVIIRHAAKVTVHEITWVPGKLSASFHGRDLFAPVAARLGLGLPVPGEALAVARIRRRQWPDDLAKVIYVDAYGNLITGVRATTMPVDSKVKVGAQMLCRARTFSDVAKGDAFWYANSSEMVEIAVNSGNAAKTFAIGVGDRVEIVP